MIDRAASSLEELPRRTPQPLLEATDSLPLTPSDPVHGELQAGSLPGGGYRLAVTVPRGSA